MANSPEKAVALAKEAMLLRALKAEIQKQGSQVDPEVEAPQTSMQPGVVNPNPKPNGERVTPPNVWSTSNLVPGPSGESKLAATWNPAMDPDNETERGVNQGLGWNAFNNSTQDPWSR